ncbi:hypothetical protein Nepgr_009303 [Nepenthes gracilis]|uniref:Uncharacterized protein n=1 Tax=Nepenthes gracilis TaxID=150966 RepID=A0AAD3SAD6_NEPGR|nr:hypothetical protein Nepgr_009303 [Nepenthes gracilis]
MIPVHGSSGSSRPMITRIASKACSWSWWLLVVRLYSRFATFQGMMFGCICYNYVAWRMLAVSLDVWLGCCVFIRQVDCPEPSTNVEFLLVLAWLAGY